MNADKDKYVFMVKTVQSGAFRILVEALKEILTDTNLIFDKSGIKLVATDNSQIVLVHMKLFCLLYTSPSPRDATLSRMPSSA